jgi:pyrroline-5-carboxylate reductase
MKIAVIGCGNLGKTIVNGLLNNGPVSPEEIIATKRNGTQRFQFSIDQRNCYIL